MLQEALASFRDLIQQLNRSTAGTEDVARDEVRYHSFSGDSCVINRTSYLVCGSLSMSIGTSLNGIDKYLVMFHGSLVLLFLIMHNCVTAGVNCLDGFPVFFLSRIY